MTSQHDHLQHDLADTRRACGEIVGEKVVCLVPARTDTSWWHESVHGIAEVRFLRGRLRFNDRRGPRAPFRTAILIYRPQTRVDPDWATTRQGEPV